MKIKEYNYYPLKMAFSDNTEHYVYILECCGGKYYIGRTTNPKLRLQEHWDGIGAAWTQKFDVKRVVDIIKTNNPYSEINYTLEYMKLYGINKVRGGPYVQITLKDEDVAAINLLLNSLSTCTCLECGSQNHKIDTCIKKKNFKYKN